MRYINRTKTERIRSFTDVTRRRWLSGSAGRWAVGIEIDIIDRCRKWRCIWRSVDGFLNTHFSILILMMHLSNWFVELLYEPNTQVNSLCSKLAANMEILFVMHCAPYTHFMLGKNRFQCTDDTHRYTIYGGARGRRFGSENCAKCWLPANTNGRDATPTNARGTSTNRIGATPFADVYDAMPQCWAANPIHLGSAIQTHKHKTPTHTHTPSLDFTQLYSTRLDRTLRRVTFLFGSWNSNVLLFKCAVCILVRLGASMLVRWKAFRDGFVCININVIFPYFIVFDLKRTYATHK